MRGADPHAYGARWKSPNPLIGWPGRPRWVPVSLGDSAPIPGSSGIHTVDLRTPAGPAKGFRDLEGNRS